MEVITRDSTYVIPGGKVYKKEGSGLVDVGSFVGLFQRMPSGGAVPSKQENDLPLRLWYSTPEQALHQTSPIVAINP